MKSAMSWLPDRASARGASGREGPAASNGCAARVGDVPDARHVRPLPGCERAERVAHRRLPVRRQVGIAQKAHVQRPRGSDALGAEPERFGRNAEQSGGAIPHLAAARPSRACASVRRARHLELGLRDVATSPHRRGCRKRRGWEHRQRSVPAGRSVMTTSCASIDAASLCRAARAAGVVCRRIRAAAARRRGDRAAPRRAASGAAPAGSRDAARARQASSTTAPCTPRSRAVAGRGRRCRDEEDRSAASPLDPRGGDEHPRRLCGIVRDALGAASS